MSDIIRMQAVSVIPINAEGKILLQLRDDRPDINYPNCWTIFGGAVESNETPDQAIQRKLLENIEFELPLRLWKVQTIPIKLNGQSMIVESYTYVGFIDRDTPEIKLNKGQTLDYFGPEDLDDLKIGFNFAKLFREFFAALADGKLFVEINDHIHLKTELTRSLYINN